VLRGLLIASVVGLTVFGISVWRISDFETLPPSEARVRFSAVRDSLPAGEPLLLIEPGGGVAPNPAADAGRGGRVRTVGFLAYRAADDRLLRLDVPFWFYRFKEPSTRFFLAQLDVDLAHLRITSDQLAGHGPGLVLDESLPNGNRLLVWLE
jgi:hypothetical protein